VKPLASPALSEQASGCSAAALPWYAVHTQPHGEPIAEAHLVRVCEQLFCPRYRQLVILHGYRRQVTRPLFPGYLFAAFDLRRDFRMVHYAHGVRGVVMFGGEPAVVPSELLADIEARMENGCVVLEPPSFHDGQRCEIIAGHLQGYTGIFQGGLNSSERVMLLLDTLKYQARVVVDRAAVRAV
jgi:transcriptional antiterminator RfaH